MAAGRITFDIISCCLPQKKNTLRDIITPSFITLRVCEGREGKGGGGGELGRFGPLPVVRRRLLVVGILN